MARGLHGCYLTKIYKKYKRSRTPSNVKSNLGNAIYKEEAS